MRSKEGLFQLIKAMSRSEKRYFTLDAKKSGSKGKRYLDMFQYINAMDDYDEAKLKKKFKTASNLSSDKAYLYDAILRSMRDYRSSKSRSAQIKEKLLDFRYLYELGLYEQGEERLKEAKELALQLNSQIALLEINKEERNIIRNKRDKNHKKKFLGLMEEKNQILKDLNTEWEYLDIYDDLLNKVTKNFILKNEEDKKEIETNYAKFLNDKKQPTTADAQHRFLQSKGLYYQLLGNFDKVYFYFKQVVDWWNKHPTYKEEEFHRYTIDISNFLHACYKNREYQYISEFIQQLEKEKPSNIHNQETLFKTLSIHKLVYFINTGENIGIDNLIQEIDNGLKQYTINPGSEKVLIFNVAVLLFVVNNFEECVDWCERLTKRTKTNSRQDILIGAYILNLIATFESKDYQKIESAIRATYRFFKKNNLSQDSFEYKIIHFVKNLANAPQSEAKQILHNLKNYIKEARENPTIRISLGLDELIPMWIESKMKKSTMNTLLKSRENVF